MAENTPGAETPPTTQSDTIVVPSNGTVDVLNNGKPIGTNKNLDDIFNKIASGTSANEAVKQTMDKQPKPAPSPEKKEEAEHTPQDKKELEDSDLNKRLTQIQDKKEKEETPSDDTDPRASLIKKTTPKVEEVTPAKVPEAAQDDVAEEELQVLPHDKPKTAKRIQALLKKIDAERAIVTETKKEAQAKADALKELEGKLKEVKPTDPSQEAAIQQQLDELAMHRRQYALDKDPEVKTRFDSRIEAATKPVADVLKRNGLGDEWIKLIESEGGWVKFATSPKSVVLKDGNRSTYADLAEEMVKALPVMDRKSVENAMMEHIQVTRDKERYFEEEKGKAKEYFTKQEETSRKQQEEHQKIIQQNTKVIEDWQKASFDTQDFLKEKPVPPDATPEQKAAIEEDNAYTKQLGQLLKQTTKITELPKVLDMALDSVKYYDERRKSAKLGDEVKRLNIELKAAKAEVDKIRAAGKSTPKSGSIASQKDSPSQSQQKAKPDSLEAAFDKLARGESLSPSTVVSDNDE